MDKPKNPVVRDEIAGLRKRAEACEEMARASSDGASRETILGRLSLGSSMTGEASLERNRRAKC